MMLGLSQRLKLPVGVTKYGIDLVVSLIGWRLGGPLGLGSLVTVFRAQGASWGGCDSHGPNE